MAEVNSIPVLYVRAKSHYDVGLTIGKTFKSKITGYLETSKDVQKYRQFYSHEDGKAIVENYKETSNKSHPDVMSEIRGMADGANVSFNDMFLLQIASELEFGHIPEVMKADEAKSNKGCTAIMLNQKDARVMGHNEDWMADVGEHVYLVHLTIVDNDDTVLKQSLSYCYPGFLPGFSFGMNKSLVVTLNSLSPLKANRNSTPLLICLRTLLWCHSIDECFTAMKNEPYGCAYGMNINIGTINGNEMCSMEVFPYKEETQINIKHVQSDQGDDCFYFHTNMYQHTDNSNASLSTAGSMYRQKRITEMMSPRCLNDVKNILGDTKCDKEPIFREPSPSHVAPRDKTTATALFDISKRVLHVYRSNPKVAPAPIVSLPFL